MSENQKYGILTMISSFLLVLLALVLSEGWVPQADYLYNILNLLDIRLFLIGEPDQRESFYLIDVPTKYIMLAFLSLGAYGFTTYLEITPALRPWARD